MPHCLGDLEHVNLSLACKLTAFQTEYSAVDIPVVLCDSFMHPVSAIATWCSDILLDVGRCLLSKGVNNVTGTRRQN